MSGTKADRRLIAGLLVALLGIGGFAIWKARGPRRQAVTPAQEAELEKQRLAAFDPTFDPAKPAGSIEGLVKDADGKPVDGAVVAILRNRGKDELPTAGRPTPRLATTSGGGRFRLADVLPGEYAVTASAAEGAPARQGKVEVKSGQKTDLTLTLGKGGVLFTGEVFDVGGGPIAGARALVRTQRDFKGPNEPGGTYLATSDDKGVFRIRLVAGEHSLEVRADGYAPARDWLSLSTAQSRRYRLNPAARLTGRVLDRGSKQPVPGATVWLRLDRLEGYVDRETTANNDGEFAFDDLAAGGYAVMARADKRIGLSRTVDVGIAQAVTDVEVLVEKGRAIRGTVVGTDGKGLEGVRVAAGRADPPFERPVFAKSTAGGAFAIEGLLPAKYRVNAWMEKSSTARPENAQVTSQDVEGLRLQLTTAVVVRGQVLDGNGNGVPEAAVMGVAELKGPDRQVRMDRATTDAAGKFELNRLSGGTLTVTANHQELGVGQWTGEMPAGDAPITVRLVAAAVVAGTVKFEDGKPAAKLMVAAQPMEMGRSMFAPPQQATTDEAGRFRIGGLKAGHYMVMARRPDSFMMSNPRARQEVTLAGGEEKTDLELQVPTGGKRIAGRVLGEDGKPVSGALVSVGLEREGYAFRMPAREGFGGGGTQAVSDADGGFALEDLVDGKYTIWAADSAHADGELKGVAAGTTGAVVKLAGGSSVAGIVQTRDGKPVGDYSIVALPGGRAGASPDERFRNQMQARMWSPTAQVHDPAGAFFMGRLSPGSYELTVTTADNQAGMLPVTVGTAEKKTGLAILIETAAKLVGRVIELDSGGPLEGANVNLTGATNRQSATTGKDGSFTIEGVSPGRTRVNFQLGEIGQGQTHIGEHLDIEVKPGTPTVDVGVIKLMKGSWKDKGDMASRGRVGFTVSLVDGKASVTGVIPGFPAEKHGLKQGELVLTVNGRATDGLGNGALDYLAAGKLSEPVTVTVKPREGGAPREVTVERVPMDYDPAHPGASRSNPPTAAK